MNDGVRMALSDLQRNNAISITLSSDLSEDLAVVKALTGILEEFQVEDIVIFKMEENSHFGDTLIACSVDSSRQSKSMSDQIIRRIGKSIGAFIEGEENGDWIVIKIGAIMLHIMKKEVREYYNVDELWKKVSLSHTVYIIGG